MKNHHAWILYTLLGSGGARAAEQQSTLPQDVLGGDYQREGESLPSPDLARQARKLTFATTAQVWS